MTAPLPTPPRLVALDLDGTLLDPSGQVSTRSLAVLGELRARGVHLVAATGRPPQMIGDVADATGGAFSYVVGSNGTFIAKLPGPELLRIIGYDADIARTIVTMLRCIDDRYGFALATEDGFAHEPGFAERLPAAVHNDACPDVLALSGQEAFKLMIFHAELPVDRLLVELPPLLGDGVRVGHLGVDAVEVGPLDLDKGAGLRWLCDHLGVASGEVWAFGDERNDITMLEFAAHGVAMATAAPEVLAVADEIAPPNSEDGVAVVLERLLDRW